jgi:hypothetical protein
MTISQTFAISVFAAMCLLSAAKPSFSQTEPPTPEALGRLAHGEELLKGETDAKQRIARWEKSLSELSKRENATIFMALDTSGDPPNMKCEKPYGEAAMKALSMATRTQWKQMYGVQTFSLMPLSKIRERTAAALDWIATLPDPAFRRLCSGKTKLSEIDSDGQDLMLELAAFEPDVAFALLDHADSIIMQVQICPKVRYAGPIAGAIKEVSIGGYSLHDYPVPHPDGIAPTVLERSPRGPLKFGDGIVLTLRELAERARSTFGLIYEYDWRIADSRYFLCGSFDKFSFEKALDVVTNVPRVLPRRPGSPDMSADLALLRARMRQTGPPKIDVSQLRMMIRVSSSADIDLINQQFGPTEQIDAASFLDGAVISAGSLCRNMPGLSTYMDSQGITPDMMLTLDADFGLMIGMDGVHAYSRGGSDPASLGMMGSNTTSILFK